MPSFLTSTTLIESVKRRAHIPESQSTFEAGDFLAFANEEIAIGILPSVLQYHQEYLVYSKTTPLVAGVSTYPIPDRAVGTKARAVLFLDAAGNLREMVRIEPEDITYWQNRSTRNDPHVFYFQNNNIVLVPDVGQGPTGSLVVRYFQRPNQLVASNAIANIVSINVGTNSVVVDALPTTFNTSSPLDIIEKAGAHKCRVIDLVPSTINPALKTLTFSSLPSDLAVGDMVSLAGEAFVPQIPDELHVVLAQRVACRCLEAQGDTQGLQTANVKLQEMEVKMGVLINNRSDGNPQKVNNLRSPLRAAKLRRRRSTY